MAAAFAAACGRPVRRVPAGETWSELCRGLLIRYPHFARVTEVDASDGKETARNAGEPSSIPGFGRAPGEGNGTYSRILAWRIPWTEEPSRLHSSWGRKESETTD